MKSRIVTGLLMLVGIQSVVDTGGAQEIEFRGQLSTWLFAREAGAQWSARYIPELFGQTALGASMTLDAQFAVKAFGTHSTEHDGFLQTSVLDLYRLWARLSSAQFEARLGLQKINFGPALLLRPLMWFDRIDPRDPLSITDGVYGLVLRYTFLNNTNVRFWMLLGNSKPRGWEVFGTRKRTPEFGGRIQVPVSMGELALSLHTREANLAGSPLFPFPVAGDVPFAEHRIALDGRFDVGVGLWFESVLLHREFELTTLRYQRFFLLGADYTFGIGNGLHVIAEHLQLDLAARAFGSDQDLRFSALACNYPFGLLDRLQAIIFYVWEDEQFFRYLSWQRTYDRWNFYVNFFWNPKNAGIPAFRSENEAGFGGGLGVQVMLVFTH